MGDVTGFGVPTAPLGSSLGYPLGFLCRGSWVLGGKALCEDISKVLRLPQASIWDGSVQMNSQQTSGFNPGFSLLQTTRKVSAFTLTQEQDLDTHLMQISRKFKYTISRD